MDRKKLVLLVSAMTIAVASAFLARSMFAGSSAPVVEAAVAVPKGPKILVAQRSLPVGTIITPESISFQQWPEDLVNNAYFIEGESDISKLLGTVVRHPITAGQPVTHESLVSPGDRGFLAAALGPGMRAVTVPVSDNTGVAGFVFPGDRVDMVLTQTVGEGGEGESLKTSETILRNIRVLATDQSTTTKKGEDGEPLVQTFRTVTLEVTPKIAEKVAVAQTIGTLSLSLRSISDSAGDLESAVASGKIKIPDGLSPEEEEKMLRKAMASPSDGPSSFVTGGDVSRFQRSTKPSPPRSSNPSPSSDPTSLPASMVARMSPAPAAASAAPPKPAGPVVNVTRGKETTAVSVSGK